MQQPPPIPWINPSNAQIGNFLGSPCPAFVPDANDSITISLYNIIKPNILQVYSMINAGSEAERKGFIGGLYDYCRLNPDFGNNSVRSRLIDGTHFANRDAFINQHYEYLFTSAEAIDARINLIIQGGEAINLYSMYRHENVPTHDVDTKMLAGEYFNNNTNIAAVPAIIKERMHRYRYFLSVSLFLMINTLFTGVYIARHNQYLNLFPPVNGQTWENIFTTALAPGRSRVRICMMGTPARELMALLHQPFNGANPPVYDINNDSYLSTLISVQVSVKLTPHAAHDRAFPLVDLYIPRLTNCDNHQACLGHNPTIHSFFATEQSRRTTMDNLTYPVPNGLIPYIDKPYNIFYTINQQRIFPDQFNVRLVPNGYLIWDTMRMLLVSQALDQRQIPNKFMKYKQKLTCILNALNVPDISTHILRVCDNFRSYPTAPKLYMLGGDFPRTNQTTQTNKNKIEDSAIKANYTKAVNQNQSNTSEMQTTTEPEYSEQFIREARAFIRPMIEEGIPFEQVDTSKFTKPEHWAGYMEWQSYIQDGYSDYRLPPLDGDDFFPEPINDVEIKIPELSAEMVKIFFPLMQKPASPTRLGGRYRLTKKRSKAGKRVTGTRKH